MIELERLMETCWRRDGTDILLFPGCRPLLRLKDSWRELQTDLLQQADVQSLADEVMRSGPTTQADGYVTCDLSLADGRRLRGMVFGHPQATGVMLTR